MPDAGLDATTMLNPVWKAIARSLAGGCSRCGQPRLYSVFDAYAARGRPRCLGCAAAVELARPLVKRVFGEAGVSDVDVKRLMADAFIRRSMLNVVRGIGHFGLKVPQPTAVPVVIVWNYTNRCNLSCIHCHQDSGDGLGNELSSEERFELIDRLGEAGISILTFSGGEPLLRPDVFAAVERASKAGLLCTIASNGTLMTREVAGRLKASGVRRVEIGLDGCTPETHDFLRGMPGAFKAAVRGIRNCVEEGFDEVCATMTLHAKNVHELPATIDLAERLGVGRFYLNRLIPAGRGREMIGLDVTREEKVQALECIYARFHQSVTNREGIQCYARGMTYYGRLGYERSGGEVFTVSEALSGYSRMWSKFGNVISEIVKTFAPRFGGCSAGITYAGMTASGDLLPCVPAPIKLGNLLQDDLEDLWVNNRLLDHIRHRDQLQGSCGSCSYNRICGGCRYTAYAVNGDWLAADPSCPFGPSVDAQTAKERQ